MVSELLSVGIILLIGIVGGNLSHRLKIPKITGYMVVGLLAGPSVFGLLSHEIISDIYLINDIALGLILFAIGGEVELQHLKSLGRKIIYITLAESFGAFILVAAASIIITEDWGLSLLLGTIAMATAPGVVLLVIREYNARGILTESLLAVVAINNIICLVVFRLLLGIYGIVGGESVGIALLSIGRELLLSIVIGGAIGWLITLWEQKIHDLSELLLVIIGGLLVAIGLSNTVGISHLMVCMIVGAVTNNLSMMHRLVYAELRQTEMPFYIAFFVLSGASLHIDLLPHVGLLGILYLILRPLGKWAGAVWAGKKFGAAPVVNKYLGVTLIPQAGVAIGMILRISDSYPEMGQMIGTIVFSSVIIYEGLGPLLTRLALDKAGEIAEK